MAISTFYSFVVGADRPVGKHLIRALAAENLVYKGLSIESQDRFAMQSSGQPFFILTPSIFQASDWNEVEFWVRRAEEYDAPVVLVSSLAIFDDSQDGSVAESALSYANTAVSETIRAAEACVRACRRHLILRCGQPFSVSAGDFVHTLLTLLREQHHLITNDQKSFSPTPVDDIGSVLLAILKQADCSDNLWGTYHFNGVEPVTAYAFAEALLAEASQYEDLTEARLEAASDGLKPEFPMPNVDVSLLFHTFGIKRKPWRPGLGRLVRQYYRADEPESGGGSGKS